MPSIEDVAKLARVSPATVSNVLNQTRPVREDTRKRVLEAVKRLNYRPNEIARSLKRKKTKSVGVIVPSISNPFYPSIVRGIEELLATRGYSILLYNTDRERTKELKAIETFFEKQVDGVVFASASLAINTSYITTLRNNGVAVVAFDQRLDDPGVDVVTVDNVQGGYIGARYLIELGHSRIAFVSGPLSRLTRRHRFDGYKKALSECGVILNEYLLRISVNEEEIANGNYEFENGYLQTLSLLKLPQHKRPTAIFAINDLTAIGCLKALQESGIDVPGEISLVGYDDIPLAGFVTPGLTTIVQPKYEMGRIAAQLLLERMEGNYLEGEGRIRVLEPRLSIRQSTARAASHASL
ncbi:MAG TPA: LacI family transcriptional regulator [Firmicutes bacterium]|nr:LacI family transcriptional regulator [Bacillota bacterium]